jgi:hypothetical protein
MSIVISILVFILFLVVVTLALMHTSLYYDDDEFKEQLPPEKEEINGCNNQCLPRCKREDAHEHYEQVAKEKA